MLGRLSPLVCAAVLSLGLGGCGTEAESGSQQGVDHDALAMGHGGQSSTSGAQLLPEERFARALATVVEVNLEGGEITLDHEALDGIDMGAMTMAFAVAGDVELGTIAAGDRVAVRIRQRKNYTYELEALCRAEGESLDCLK